MTLSSRIVTIIGVIVCTLAVTVGAVASGATTQAQLHQSQRNMEGDVNPGDLPGDGTESNPYQISNISELQAMADNLTADYELVSEINASQTTKINGGSGFTPVGSPGNPFNGTFDGNSHTVTDLAINRSDEGYVGLFGTNSGTIRNVALTSVRVTGNNTVGGLVGINSGYIQNAQVSGSVSGEKSVGELVGSNRVRPNESGLIQNVSVSGSVSGNEKVGGLVGINGGYIQNARVSGSVSGIEDVGGLVGSNRVRPNESGLIQNVSVSGSVSGNEKVGGLVGQNGFYGAGNITIKNVRASGSVSGIEDVGGLVGFNHNSLDGSTEIQNTISVGPVTGTDAGTTGGVIGYNSGINPTITVDSYWDKQATGQAISSGNATGLRTVQMQGSEARSNLSGLNFGSAWETHSDRYPTLAAHPLRETTTAPEADFSWDRPVIVDNPVLFDASPTTDESGDIELYMWDFDGDGNYDDSSGFSTSYTFSSPGSYDVAIKVIDSDGNLDTVDYTVEVRDAPGDDSDGGSETVT